MKILVLNGPNINMLGVREPEIYGGSSYKDLIQMVTDHAVTRGVLVEFYQSNHEGDLVDAIQRAYFDNVDGIVFNPAAYTHTSIAILDAVKATSIPVIEVHISNVAEREEFRQISYIRQVAKATICGKGFRGYTEAIDILIEGITSKQWK
ncbi:MAG: type II 3-dehydroquinate dehydratase [Clostridia bacterium]|nr:type II 3-dehydroquinate dehydratase [Clostridia bacterium]